ESSQRKSPMLARPLHMNASLTQPHLIKVRYPGFSSIFDLQNNWISIVNRCRRPSGGFQFGANVYGLGDPRDDAALILRRADPTETAKMKADCHSPASPTCPSRVSTRPSITPTGSSN